MGDAAGNNLSFNELAYMAQGSSLSNVPNLHLVESYLAQHITSHDSI
jgi:hypothetical protein